MTKATSKEVSAGEGKYLIHYVWEHQHDPYESKECVEHYLTLDDAKNRILELEENEQTNYILLYEIKHIEFSIETHKEIRIEKKKVGV